MMIIKEFVFIAVIIIVTLSLVVSSLMSSSTHQNFRDMCNKVEMARDLPTFCIRYIK